jgi:hypothetical protein
MVNGSSTINKIETAYVLYHRDELIECFLLNTGDDRSCVLEVDRVLKKAILNNATSIIMAHNHPSGDTSPSIADKRCTERLMKSCDVLNIRFKDHIIVSSKCNAFSFEHSGLLGRIQDNYKLLDEVATEGSYVNLAYKITDKFCQRLRNHNTLSGTMEQTKRELEKLYIKFFDPII